MVIGSYGKGNGKKRTWGYVDEGGGLVYTDGFKASAPMYVACVTVCETLGQIAKGVFDR